MIHKKIEEKLNKIFTPIFLEIVNESYYHNVPAGSESHFKITIVSDLFIYKNLLERHRNIYKELSFELSNNIIHALTLKTYTSKEWLEIQTNNINFKNKL